MEKRKILIVDDEQDFADVIKLRLEANNYAVATLTHSKDILTVIKKEIPDLILLDIVMPGIDGYQVAKLIRQDMNASAVPIVLLTGKDLEPKETYRKCLDLGITGFLAKPVESKELLSKIKEILK